MNKHLDTVNLIDDSTALYAACGSDDLTAQTAAYRALWEYLYRVAAYMTRAQPDGDALAQDCAQKSLLRVYQKYETCKEPAAFRIWARRIVSNLVIDELRRRQRLQPLPEPEHEAVLVDDPEDSLETAVLTDLTADSLRHLLQYAPISDRSRRVVVGRYLDETADDLLAEAESNLSEQQVLPSHIQVTRSKNIAKLRRWSLLITFLQEATNGQ